MAKRNKEVGNAGNTERVVVGRLREGGLQHASLVFGVPRS